MISLNFIQIYNILFFLCFFTISFFALDFKQRSTRSVLLVSALTALVNGLIAMVFTRWVMAPDV